jgi:hypothetical protein
MGSRRLILNGCLTLLCRIFDWLKMVCTILLRGGLILGLWVKSVTAS